MVGSALDIRIGEELLAFDQGEVVIDGTRYAVLTGHESPPLEGVRRCFWCGGALSGHLKRYCRGHMKLYYQHFEWGTASYWARERADYRCANCGKHEDDLRHVGLNWQSAIEVHHIVPLLGGARAFSAFNLPWNLIVFCHNCHLEVHAAMRPAPKTVWDLAAGKGQGVMPFAS